MKIYSRERWGARQGRSGMAQQASPTEAFIHYTDGAASTIASTDRFVEQAAAMRGIQGFHMDGRGWSDIAYHFVVFQPYGSLARARVFEARPVRYVPAAQAGRNTGTLAICVNAAPGMSIKPNTRYAIEEIIKRYPSVKSVGGHRDVVSTDCPGDKLYAAIPQIARAAGVKVYG